MNRTSLLTLALLMVLSMFYSPLLFADAEILDINSGMNNRDITFSPDGKMLLTTITAPKNLASVIAISHKKRRGWSALSVAPFSGKHMDIEAAFAPDGRSVFFSSKRPKPDREGSDWDIWQVSYDDGDWGEPANLGAPVNSPGNEFYPSVTLDGTLYFTATLEGGLGHEDLYRSKPENGIYRHIENIGSPVNSAAYEFNAFIAPDESYLIFGSQGRENEKGGGDLFISYRQDGQFSEPVLLSDTINGAKLDYCPTVFDGYFYFTSERTHEPKIDSVKAMEKWYGSSGNGLGDIYRIPFNEIVN